MARRTEHNPSAWPRRLLICLIAAIALAISAYLALYQLRVIASVWDPLFGSGAERVLDSAASVRIRRILGVPDAALGALAYLSEIAFALIGSARRWQTRSWLVLLFGADALGLVLVSIALVITQATIVNAWCFLCLISASCSIVIALLAWDEVRAALRSLRH